MKYRTIVADPPWPYDTRDAMQSATKLDGTRPATVGRPSSEYAYMPLADIKLLDVAGWSEPDAHLYLWTTNAFMVEAHQVAAAWGFRPKTILTWVKMKEDGEPSMKAGYWFRGATEHVVFCVRGRLPGNATLPTAFLWPRAGHSEKPAAFYDMVESMSPGPYLDVFARKQRFGWDAWGSEVYTPEGLPEPAR